MALIDKFQLVKLDDHGEEYYGEVLSKGSDNSRTLGIYRWNENEYYLGEFNNYRFNGLCMRSDNGFDYLGLTYEGVGNYKGVSLYDDTINIRIGTIGNVERYVALYTKLGAIRFYEAINHGLAHGRSVTYIPSKRSVYFERFNNGTCVSTSRNILPFKANRDFLFSYERLGPLDPWRSFRQGDTHDVDYPNIKGQYVDCSENGHYKRGILAIQWDASSNYALELGQSVKRQFDGWGVSRRENGNIVIKFMKDTPNKLLRAGLRVCFIKENDDVTIQFIDEVHNTYSDFIRYFKKTDAFVLGSLDKVTSGKFIGKCLRVFNFEKVQVSNFSNGSFVSNDFNVIIDV